MLVSTMEICETKKDKHAIVIGIMVYTLVM